MTVEATARRVLAEALCLTSTATLGTRHEPAEANGSPCTMHQAMAAAALPALIEEGLLVDDPDPGPCDEETWSWDHYRPEQMDPYWIRCCLRLGHDGPHSDRGNTGLTWDREAR